MEFHIYQSMVFREILQCSHILVSNLKDQDDVFPQFPGLVSRCDEMQGGFAAITAVHVGSCYES